MAAVLSYFEVQLSEDVLHDIKTEGKMFKVDLMDIQQSYDDLAGADYTKTALSAAENQHKLPVPRIQLEKLNERIIRLFITGCMYCICTLNILAIWSVMSDCYSSVWTVIRLTTDLVTCP